jgi:hypothetical protein
MIPYLILTVIGVGAGVILSGDDEPPTPQPVEVAQASFEPVASAMYWVGGCSVACSLIWGTCIVYTAKLKRKDYR